MKLRFTPRAIEDLNAIADYLRERSPSAARSVRKAIFDSLQLLLIFPRIGRQQTTEGVRKLVTRRYAYLVYYTTNEATEEIVILSIKHPAQERKYTDT